MADRYCNADGFAAAMASILSDVEGSVDAAMPSAVEEGCKVGRKAVRSNARAAGFVQTGEYAKGFAYKTRNRKGDYSGEIGNKRKPGLVHLLEKGHAKVGGGRVPGTLHVAPAADEAFDAFERAVGDAVEGSL